MKSLLTLVFLLSHVSLAHAQDEVNYPEKSKQSRSVCTKNVCEPDQVSMSDKTLKIRGQALFRYYFFKIYVATFYSEIPIETLPDIYNSSGDKFLKIEYLRSINANEFIDNSKKALKEIPYADTSAIKDELDRLYRAYEEVKEGESYSLYYSKKNSLTCLFKNDIKKVCLKGDAFFKAYFSIWLSEYSLDNEFSEQLIKIPEINE